MTETPRTRELPYEERSRWGECPACHAKDGEPCNPDVGFSIGRNAYGQQVADGVHMGRLWNAPKKVREVPVD